MTLRVNVHPVDTSSLQGVPDTVVAICVYDNPEQRHLALMVKPEGQASHLLIHHGWEGADYFYCEAPEDRFCWVALDQLDPLLIETFADFVYEVWQVNSGTGMPYSVAYHDMDYFDDAKKLTALPLGEGLTCSTFVLECFASYQLPLVDKGSWPIRDEDKAWADRILDMLARRNAPASDAQRRYAGMVARYRPEEVAAAAGIFDGAPVPFDQASQLTGSVLDQMKSLARLG